MLVVRAPWEGLAHAQATNPTLPLQSAWIAPAGGVYWSDLAGGVDGVAGIGVTPRMNAGGHGCVFSDVGTGSTATALVTIGSSSGSAAPKSDRFSILARVQLVSGSKRRIYAGGTDSAAFSVRSDGLLDFDKASRVAIGVSTAGVSWGVPTDIAVTYDGFNAAFYVDGLDAGTGSSAQTFAHGQQYFIGSGNSAGTSERVVNGDVIHFVALFGDVLSSDVIGALAGGGVAALFEPRRIWVPVSAGGGATNLTVAEASHGHAADSLTLSIGVSLAINDATHAHAADSLTLSTAATLAVADATHAHAADQVTLTLAGSESLTIADATHAHAADVAGLTLDSLLAVADALHAHSADNVVLGVTGAADLVIADAAHAHSVDGLVLTAQSLLAIQDALHAHAADALTIDSAPTLLIADALHAHTSDGLLLTVDAWLVIADALHGHTADSITLGDSGAVVLIVADAVHAHAADTLRLFYEVWAATKAPIGARYASGARAARLSTTARQPRLSTRTR